MHLSKAEIADANAVVEQVIESLDKTEREWIVDDSYTYVRAIRQYHYLKSSLHGARKSVQSGEVEEITRRVSLLSQRGWRLRTIIRLFLLQLGLVIRFALARKKVQVRYSKILSLNADLEEHLKGVAARGVLLILSPVIIANRGIGVSKGVASIRDSCSLVRLLLDERRVYYRSMSKLIDRQVNRLTLESKKGRRIDVYSAHQSFIENRLCRLLGGTNIDVNIALHGGNYGFLKDYPIMWFHCLPRQSRKLPTLLLPSELIEHCREETSEWGVENQQSTKEQYGFEVFKRASLRKNFKDSVTTEIRVFATNIERYRDSGCISRGTLDLSEAMKRWQRIDALDGVSLRVIMRPLCLQQLRIRYKSIASVLRLQTEKYEKGRLSHINIFEGPSTAIRKYWCCADLNLVLVPLEYAEISKRGLSETAPGNWRHVFSTDEVVNEIVSYLNA